MSRSKIGWLRRARRPVHRAGLARLEGEPDVLDPLGHEVQPEELDREERDRQARHEREGEEEDLGRSRRDEQERHLPDVVVGEAPLLDPGHDRAEPVVGHDHRGRVLGHVRARAHGDPDVRLPERGRVVDPVPGHGHELAVLLEGPDDVELLERRDPGEDPGPVHEPGVRDAASMAPVTTSSSRSAIPSCRASASAVTGWSPVTISTRTPARRHSSTASIASGRSGSMKPARPEQRQRRERSLVEVRRLDAVAEGALGDREHAVAAGREREEGLLDPFPVERKRPLGTGHGHGQVEHDLDSPLQRDHRACAVRMQLDGDGGRVPPLGLVRNPADDPGLDRGRVDPESPAEAQEGGVDRVAEDADVPLLLDLDRLARGDRGPGEGAGPVRKDAVLDHVLCPDLPDVGEPDRLEALAVHGERPGLVGRDHRAGAEPLDRRHPPHDHRAFRHARGRDREHDRQRDGKALGDGRDRERDRDEEDLRERRPRQNAIPASTMRATTTAMLIVRANRSIRSIRGGFVPSLPETAAAIAPISVRPPVATATPAPRPEVTTVPAWAMERRSATGASAATGLRRLLDREGLAGQGRLVHGEIVDLDEPEVGRDAVSRLQQHPVARDHVLGRHGEVAAAPDDPDLGLEQVTEGLGRALGLPLLEGPDDRVREHDHEDEGRVAPVSEPGRDRGRREEDIDQRASELPEKEGQRTRRGSRRQPVRAVCLKPGRSLRTVEAAGAGAEPLLDLASVQRVPRGRRRLPGHPGRDSFAKVYERYGRRG